MAITTLVQKIYEAEEIGKSSEVRIKLEEARLEFQIPLVVDTGDIRIWGQYVRYDREQLVLTGLGNGYIITTRLSESKEIVYNQLDFNFSVHFNKIKGIYRLA